jgi:DNA-directed RNA polymerase subunit K/omega
MAASTQDMKKFENVSGNIFKGILMIAKRGRQINDRYYESEIREQEEEPLEEESLELIPDENYVAKPKPVIVAAEEYYEAKIKLVEKED